MSRTLAGGFSEAALFVDQVTKDGRRHLLETHTLGLNWALESDLELVWSQCRHADWDGFKALPISRASLQRAREFLESLPRGLPAPSIGAEPDGSVTMEWYFSTSRTLSISVGKDETLHYAGIFGLNSAYGAEELEDEAPNTIVRLIQRVYTSA